MKIHLAVPEYCYAYWQTGIPYEWKHTRKERGEMLIKKLVDLSAYYLPFFNRQV
jgi:hypothetical protein